MRSNSSATLCQRVSFALRWRQKPQNGEERPDRIKQVDLEVEQWSQSNVHMRPARPSDFVTMIEAPNNKTVARVSVEMRSRGTVQIASPPAIPVEKFAY